MNRNIMGALAALLITAASADARVVSVRADSATGLVIPAAVENRIAACATGDPVYVDSWLQESQEVWAAIQAASEGAEPLWTAESNDVWTAINAAVAGAEPLWTAVSGTVMAATSDSVKTNDSRDINLQSGRFAVGESCIATGVAGSAAFGYEAVSADSGAFAEGSFTRANANSSHAEGYESVALGHSSHAEGYGTEAGYQASHAEGKGSRATANESHAEGFYTEASGTNSHAEGNNTEAAGSASHAEGFGTYAAGANSHAEGNITIAQGSGSHAEGLKTIAEGAYSHAAGYLSKATDDYSYVWSGKLDRSDTNTYYGSRGKNTYSVNAPGGIYLTGPVTIRDTNLVPVLYADGVSLKRITGGKTNEIIYSIILNSTTSTTANGTVDLGAETDPKWVAVSGAYHTVATGYYPRAEANAFSGTVYAALSYVPTDTVIYAESDPIWTADSTGVLTKVTAASTYASIAAWQAAMTNYWRVVAAPATTNDAGNRGDMAPGFMYDHVNGYWIDLR